MSPEILERTSGKSTRELIYTGTSSDWIYRIWRRSCILGAVVALAVSACISLVISTYLAQYRFGVYSVLGLGLITTAAVLEGGLVGYFQWRVLRRVFPTMRGQMWISVSMIAAAAGCILSWLPTSFAFTVALASRIGDVTTGPAAVARIVIVTGALVGIVWGVAQYAVLRLHAHRAGNWILASTLTWMISFVWLYVAAFLPDRTTSAVVHIVLAVGAGVVLGSFSGILNGRVLLRLGSRLIGSALT
jgi:hypothetical protein